MDTSELKRFAQGARRQLLDQVGARLEHVLRTDSVELREKQKVVDELQAQIEHSLKQAVIDRVAYTWFNRFCALRFMDVNHYTRVGVVSPTEGFSQPEILQEAKQGVFDESFKVDHERVQGLLSGNILSSNPQLEAYRLLLVGACNAYHERMPFLFEEIEDYTELLMPDDLLSENSVLQGVREALTPEACQDVEVIGWLYQYYISERKDEVFASLKKNKKIQPEDIPAATQLFTPHWIVRYLVENSLGRLWMLNHPESKLTIQMEYYIRPEQEETDFLEIGSPEEIKVCDPACGSGHMLTYAFDLLYAIYEEQGYDQVEVPSLILANNLYGIEIDERAGDLAAFALMMKARGKDKRFFDRNVEPNVCVLENVHFTEEDLDLYMDAVGRDLFTQDLLETLKQFEQADNFGSLIRPMVKDAGYIRERIEEQGIFDDLFLHQTNQKVMKVLSQAEFLSSYYHVVLTNPPYMGSRGMNEELKRFANDDYPISKSDLFAMFTERNCDLIESLGMVGMITMQSWMFLSSFEKFRGRILSQETILSMAHLGARAFDSIGGEVVSTTSFVIKKSKDLGLLGTYLRLIAGSNENEKEALFLANLPVPNQEIPSLCFTSSAIDFKKIPGFPIAYWASNQMREIFSEGKYLSDISNVVCGMTTGDNEKFLRGWFEVSNNKCGWGIFSTEECITSKKKWFPYNKGGEYRKWYGNNTYLVNWEADGKEIIASGRAYPRARNKYFESSITWSFVSSSNFGVRSSDAGFIFDMGGCSAFVNQLSDKELVTAFLCSKVASEQLEFLNPTLNFQVGNVKSLPWRGPQIRKQATQISNVVQKSIETARTDWDSYETSWEFEELPLLKNRLRLKSLKETYSLLRTYWHSVTKTQREMEEENNRIFIEAYALQNELTPEVPFREITLMCNPSYRYPNTSRKTYASEGRESMFLDDTLKEFISYSIGCMFGRYSLDKPGLILANQGETAEDYQKQVPDPTFPPDDDNVIPILDEGWFPDDLTERFKVFLRTTFSEEHYEENLAYLEEAIGRDIRSYFLKEFHKEHMKMYKKRPIYWLFSSPNGSFNALIYMHRYRPDTISVILNDYLRSFREKLNAQKAHLQEIERSTGASSSDKAKALKEIDKLNGILNEIKEYEDEILYPLATQQIDIDLDDGVKVNYKKFGKALKHVSGLS